MTVRLRPHHLLCLLTYAGRGYTPAFTANLDAVVGRLAAGEDARLVFGPDDVCAPLLDAADAHCRREGVAARDRDAAEALAALLPSLAMRPGARVRLSAGEWARLRQAFAAGTIRQACAGCEWASLCTAIAAGGFKEAKLPG